MYKQAGSADTGTNLREMPVQFNEWWMPVTV